MPEPCLLCRSDAGDDLAGRVLVWEDALWRLTTSVEGDYTLGFSYLEPKRHIPFVTDLDGAEAATFGRVLARCAAALKQASGCQLVYVYVFGGGVAHLHVHLAPHSDGDALNDNLLRGEFESEELPSGMTMFTSTEFEELPGDELRAVADEARSLLREFRSTPP